MSWCYNCLASEHLGTRDANLPKGAVLDPFRGPELGLGLVASEGRILSHSHPLDYFKEEEVSFLLQCADFLGAKIDLPTNIPNGRDVVRRFESFSWDNPWASSNRVMFLLSDLCFHMDASRDNSVHPILMEALDWIDAHHSMETGLWAASKDIAVSDCMAATFHFSFFYFWVGREMRYPKKIIDSCLSLQEDHGLFSGPYQVGQTCLDYDAIDLLVKCALLTSHRRSEIEDALGRARQSLFLLQNPDGGFANCKIQRGIRFGIPGTREFQRRMVQTFRHPGVRSVFLKQHPATGDYSVCLDYLRCKNTESNIFSTWFRTLAINLCDTILDPERVRRDGVRFRRLPFLGYHPFE